MSLDVVVRGVGGAGPFSEPAEAMILLLGAVVVSEEDIVASAAFRFLVNGGMVAAFYFRGRHGVWQRHLTKGKV